MKAIALIIALLLLAVGCAAPGTGFGKQQLGIAGTAVDQASAYTKDAEHAVQAALPHADAVAQAFLHQASYDHAQADEQFSIIKSADVKLSQAFEIVQVQLNQKTAQIDALLHSWGHVLQVWVTWLWWVLVVLVAIHVVGLVIERLWPLTPVGMIAGIVARIVNPLGWLQWLVGSHVRAVKIQRAADVATQAAVAASATGMPVTSKVSTGINVTATPGTLQNPISFTAIPQ